MSKYEKEAKKAFPSDIHCISLTRDSSVPITSFAGGQLPNPSEKQSGSCTFAFLQAMKCSLKPNPSWKSVIQSMNESLCGSASSSSANQEAVLQSSRPLKVDKPIDLIPSKFHGTKQALLIGINYTGQQGALSMCHDDVSRMQEYLVETLGFDANNITILMDKKGHPYYPTRKNILTCFKRLAKQSQAGDAAFVYFAGHSGRMLDTTRKQGNCYVETLLPVDYETESPIFSDEICETLCAMPANVMTTCLFDACHGGSIIQLPYIYTASHDEDSLQMYQNADFIVSAVVGLAVAGGVLVAAGGSSGGGGDSGAADAAASGGGGNTAAGNSSSGAANSESEDECCGGCCEGLFEALFQ